VGILADVVKNLKVKSEGSRKQISRRSSQMSADQTCSVANWREQTRIQKPETIDK
jgi:hypothetical protein